MISTPDLDFLVRCGFEVFKSAHGIKINGRLRSEEEIKRTIERERRLKEPEPFIGTFVVPVAKTEREPEQQQSEPSVAPIEDATSGEELTCEECGGPRSVGSARRCIWCYRGLSKHPKIDELKRLDAERKAALRKSITGITPESADHDLTVACEAMDEALQGTSMATARQAFAALKWAILVLRQTRT